MRHFRIPSEEAVLTTRRWKHSLKIDSRQVMPFALTLGLALNVMPSTGIIAWIGKNQNQPTQQQNIQAETIPSNTPDVGAATQQDVSLPAAFVHLSIVLPRFSETGRYSVNVSVDGKGTQLVAQGTGTAIESAGKVRLDVMLDLRALKPGVYFLAIVRTSDNGTYYYPFKIN